MYLLRDRKFSILCSLFSPSYTCFLSLSLTWNDFFFSLLCLTLNTACYLIYMYVIESNVCVEREKGEKTVKEERRKLRVSETAE